ncbi:MAG: Holliday junction branch migration protein RuvA, partial [Clostridia bacterium]|nr:Holliday junction branch migration protein RuvA [Clostridia bacterium]
IMDVGGVGFRLNVSWQTLSQLPSEGEVCLLHTYFLVREDAMELYGFWSQREQECFALLTSVTGVGPKVALAILSELTCDQLALAVAGEDVKRLTKASGVGKKLAQRIVMELADKLAGDFAATTGEGGSPAALPAKAGDNADEAISALVVLGYTQSEALKAVRSIDPEGKTVEQLVKAALKSLMRQ